jgi:exopolysaccharide biosynthesis polyprenyl glycosylphosphotransferase
VTIRPGLIWLTLISIVIDGVALMAGAFLAYSLRFSDAFANRIPIITALPPFVWYLRLAVALTLTVLIFNLTGGLYRYPRQDGLVDELTAAAKRYMLAFTVLLAGLFFYRGASYSRLTVVILFALSGIGLLFSRLIVRWFRNRMHGRGMACRRAAIVGDGNQARRVFNRIKDRPELGLRLVGRLSPGNLPEDSNLQELSFLGTIPEAGNLVRAYQLDTLVISPDFGGEDYLGDLAKACYGVNVEFLYLPDLEGTSLLPQRMVEIGGVPFWSVKDVPSSGWPGLVKRGFDIVFSAVILLLISPIFLLIALLVKLSSRGPVFYGQRRVGLDGIEFDCLKFRSMRPDAEASTGPVWAQAGDARVTPIGKFLRRWSLDELPQLWNIFKGDMSTVGPRPERPEFVRQFAQRIEGYHERHRMRSGLTGWAQVNGLRGNVPIEERTKYDRYYIEHWSLGFDVKIILMTILTVIRGENSY